VVSPQWVGLTADGRLDVTKDAEARGIIAAAKDPAVAAARRLQRQGRGLERPRRRPRADHPRRAPR
jgi:hypothetical protein